MADTTYTVSGMTCDHCARSVEAEIRALGGVTGVTVELTTGAVTVRGAGDLSVADVRGAVEEAGYRLT
ncbi:heavy-metal-associated domain-containing protein [Amycolatopsis sp. OK19-0408]|uniref:Heavy-metal-associated domain-containing protein n=1 Tax=Amycolatopsis iheyensis TaxID=2945988 RepID=A0A9X2SPX4_9PSEU|nr:heavy metal-associated domain-containing protein [Amycolatopsis iheyensis]MCR6487960.1 heavy-metal-associated domain-containing protein [Amycolatopsis iheyensis]